MVYVSDPQESGYGHINLKADGTVANEEPFFRLETLDRRNLRRAAPSG